MHSKAVKIINIKKWTVFFIWLSMLRLECKDNNCAFLSKFSKLNTIAQEANSPWTIVVQLLSSFMINDTFTLVRVFDTKKIERNIIFISSWLNWNDSVMEASLGKHVAQFHRFPCIRQHLMLAGEQPCDYKNWILTRSVRFWIVGYWLVLLKNCSNLILTLRKHALQSSIEFVATEHRIF